MNQSACSSANWYEVGERDGLNGMPPRIDTYAYQCSRQNVQVSEADSKAVVVPAKATIKRSWRS